MIKINLVPSDIIAKAKARQLMLQAAVIGGLAAMLLVGASFGHWYGKHSLELTLVEKEAELNKLDKIVKQVEELEKAAAAVRARLGVIEDLLLGRAFYPIFMSEFARSVPAGVKVISLGTSTLSPGAIKLVIMGAANSNEDIVAWAKALENNAKFGAVELGAVSASGAAYNFGLTATYTSK